MADEHDSDCKHWDFPFALTYGLVRSLEVGIGFGGQMEERTEVHHEDNETEQCIREHSIGNLVVGAQYNTGFRWRPVESLTLDMAGGSKISGDAPDFTATAGLTWAFGFTSIDSK